MMTKEQRAIIQEICSIMNDIGDNLPLDYKLEVALETLEISFVKNDA